MRLISHARRTAKYPIRYVLLAETDAEHNEAAVFAFAMQWWPNMKPDLAQARIRRYGRTHPRRWVVEWKHISSVAVI